MPTTDISAAVSAFARIKGTLCSADDAIVATENQDLAARIRALNDDLKQIQAARRVVIDADLAALDPAASPVLQE